MKKPVLLFFTLFFTTCFSVAIGQNIVINELMSSNTASIQDEDGSYEDWIELYNKGSISVNLQGYGLSDDPLLLYKWTFPNVSLAPGQYLLVWASSKNRSVAGHPLHTNFKISASGETILLTNTSSVTLDTAPPVSLQANVSYGRLPNGIGPFVFFGTATPNAINATTGFSGNLNPPVFSQTSGFFTSGFNLILSSTDSGTTILYTLDGSEPDENNLNGTTYSYKNQYVEMPGQTAGPLLNNNYQTLQYTAPITIVDRTPQPNDVSAMSSTYSYNPTYLPSTPVFKGTTVRAKVIKPGYLPSSISTKTYFVTPQGSSEFSLPVISLNLNEDRFFDYNNGIFVAGKDFDVWRAANPNGTASSSLAGNYYRETNDERVAQMSYFVNGSEVINQVVGLKIRGGVSRRFESKSLTVYARSDYGDSDLSYKFFGDLPYTSYQRLTLSNSGGDFKSTMFRDALNHNVCKELYPEKEAYQPAVVFVNGEYWGILNIRERYDDNYFKQVYNTSATDFLTNNAEVSEGDATNYNAMINYLNSNSMAVQSNYDYIKTQLDPDSFSDYFISNIFFENEDWPNNNVFYWRNKIAAYDPTAPYGLDGRWRWMYHDMDNTFAFVSGDYNTNTLATATSENTSLLNPSWSTLILRKLLVNSNFKNNFINRFADLLNTSFLTTRIQSKIDSMKSVIYPEIPDHIARWKNPLSIGDYDYDIQYEKEFAAERPALQRNHIRSVFSIASNINATLNVSGANQGYIKMNTITIIDGTPGITGNPYPWTGIYFKNIPVTLKAIAKPGYVFSNWTGASNSTNPEITITPSANFSITAIFVVDTTSEISVPIYFWMMNGAIANNTPLTSYNATYTVPGAGVINYQSCLPGYPYPVGDPNRNKASMERRNSPTTINYRPEANSNLAYASSDMKGLQIKQPFQNGGVENTMVFNFSTVGYKKIRFSFAAIDEGAANAILIDYAVNSGSPIWNTSGLSSSSLPLTSTYQLFQTDFSSIAAADNNPNFKIRLRFTGPNMTADLGARVTFNNIAVDGVKLPLCYPSPNVYTVGTAITALNPTVSATVTGYIVSPALPAGLNLNPSTGVISGAPTIVSAATTYTITASTASGNLTFGVSIAVNDISPSNLSYTSPNVFSKNTPIAVLSPTISGGAVLSYSITPALPLGLNLNVLNGKISGTPTVISPTTTYTVTATNSGGSSSFGVVITVNDVPPSALSYSSPNVFTENSAIADLNPTISGGAVLSYSITPNLPQGLSFDTLTGVISGTPSVVASSTTYTVTAINSGGSASFGVVITVNDIAPSALSYPSPNVFTKNTTISNLSPTVSGATVLTYSISPTLPLGLFFSTTTGVISGTPTVIRSTRTYTVTATNSGGSTTFGVVITVNDIAPSALSYPSPNVFTKNTTISNLSPTISGGTVLTYSISPTLPLGLLFSTSTGVISGTPTVIRSTRTYTVTATNSGGSTSFDVLITVNDIAPSALSYPSPNVFTKNTTISNLSPNVSGGTIISYSIIPALPSGLLLNTATGVISGTPSVISGTNTYTVTATNSGGSTSFGVVITVNDIAPTALSYPSPNVFTKNTTISNLSPTISGGTIISYSITPALPSGLSFNTATGIISGTPSMIAPTATYTVTATNSGGSASFDVVITVNDVPPTALSYSSPNVFTKNTTISNLSPTISGGAVLSYNISPSLPLGLFFSTSTGVISGTPTVIRSTRTYTVTATNSGGSTSFGLVITVNDIAPSALSYPSPNVFTKNTTISNLSPTVSSGTIISYSITPALPSGLLFNTTTGVISGTPSVISGPNTYTVTATNTGGSTSFGVVITVNDIAPSALSYNSPNVFTKNATISNLSPTVSGGTIISYSITPALPSGLLFNTTTGVISGTPSVISGPNTYTVTATNTGGSTSFGVVITVNDIAPSALSYNSPNVFTKNATISNLSPTVSGGTIISYSITPALPSGLLFNTTTGIISGTPSMIAPTATYTVTATNSGGSTSFGVVITVNDIPPSALSYNSPNVFTLGTSIAPLVPTVSGGAVLNYSISPSLPFGLFFSTSTGVISGTPTITRSTRTYTVTSTNSGGSTTFGVVITVNDIAPSALSYTSPNVFTKNTTISNLSPTISGGTIISYSITPALPSGLSFNSTTGVISGTPSVISGTNTYTVIATNSGGSASFGIVITVNDIPPSNLSYNSPNVFTKNATISNLSPTVSGGTIISYSITPALPSGLSFNTANGIISGTPSMIAPTATYTVTATNSGGSTSFGVVITVNDIAPSALSYNSPNVFTLGTSIAATVPTVSGGAVLNYSISPSLPLGLSFDTSTGVISGTPSVISGTNTYTVTAFNSGGSASIGVIITVNDIGINSLSYLTPNLLTLGTSITDLLPTVTGGAVLIYTVNPSLPLGLSFDTSTGIISGTPLVISSTATYSVTATNSGGSTSFDVVITVNDVAPSALTYPSPNVFTLGTSIADLAPSVSGGAVLNYSISPSLPLGLSFDSTTGTISGTPSIISSTTTYTVTATNSGGTTSFDVVITVNDVAPSALTYPSPNVFTLGTSIADLAPSVSGGAALTYSISPNLPVGLSIDSSTGIISGTPLVISSTATYSVTVANSGGATSFDLVITVYDIAPSSLTYPSPNVYTLGTSIADLAPIVSGGAVLNYSISPSLPLGLSFDSTTGTISGTTSIISSTTTYTVTATNSGGSTSFDVVITVNDVAPSSLTYPSPNVFTLGASIADLAPTVSGGTVLNFSISPGLPLGLSFDSTTGTISGTPSIISSTTTYTVTATNSGGSTSFDVVITVNDVAPSSLTYPSPNVFTLGASIADLAPTVSGGAVLNYSISPSLPLGLSFDTSTGVISGIPLVISSTATYSVTATNSGGSTSFDVVITVNDVAPSSLTYPSPNVFTLGTSIADLAPSVSGGAVLNYSISPSLPLGLSIDTLTGVISGIPLVISSTATYSVTATNSGGSTSFDVVITVNDVAPSSLTYPSPNVFTLGTSIADLAPSVSGGAVLNYSISPSLPPGLSIDSSTGVISGIPSAIASADTYTVTAINSGGSTSFDVVITVNDVAPSSLTYPSPNVFTLGTSIADLAPSVSGGAVLNYSISPSLPLGLSFDTSSGVISGTPSVIASTTSYTVTATNSGGATSFGVVITVNDVPPSSLTYPSPNVFTLGASIADLAPTVSGGTVLNFSISPGLPLGLSFDSTTGTISGTPSIIFSTTTYTVTATNSGGSVSFNVVITVNDLAPSSLTYPSPNVFTLGTSIADLAPTVSGGTVLIYSISPSLPLGLSFDSTTGTISGTPSIISSTTTYTVTATNSGGSVSFDVVITVNDLAPSSLTYPSPNVYTLGASIADLAPTVSGGAVLNYSISPSLPLGLSFDSTTGTISGTPLAISSTTTYTVTATNSGGATSFDVVITIESELSLNQVNQDHLIVYPNPFSDNIHIHGLRNECYYQLFGAEGKLILDGSIINNYPINLVNLPNGMYWIRLLSDNKTSYFKIVKK